MAARTAVAILENGSSKNPASTMTWAPASPASDGLREPDAAVDAGREQRRGAGRES
jgi:hypothetical protein